MSNPIESITTFAAITGHGRGDKWPLYEALCLEETGENVVELITPDFYLSRQLTSLYENTKAAADFLKKSQNMLSAPAKRKQKALLLDAHLDSAWVHLMAALNLLGGNAGSLRAAWAELHESNIERKRWEDGLHHIDPISGKILKPEGWVSPNFEQFFPEDEA